MGSVKDLSIIEKPDINHPGTGRFNFSDRFSVFDWAEMPHQIKNKGKAIWIIGAYFFEKLHEMGVKTHYLGVVEDGEVKLETSFVDDLGADSLDIVELIMAMEEEFNIEIPDEDAEGISAVKDVVGYIEAKM